MPRFCYVTPGRQNSDEVIECAVKLIEQDFEQRPNEDQSHHHLFIDRKEKHFFFTDQYGLDYLLDTAPDAFNANVKQTNLNEINQWEKVQRIKA